MKVSHFFIFHEYVECFILRLVTDKLSQFLSSRMQTNCRHNITILCIDVH